MRIFFYLKCQKLVTTFRFFSSSYFSTDAPSCSPNQSRVYGVAKQEQAQIKCIVDANPPDVEFKWTFNNSAESIDVANNHVTRSGKIFTVFISENEMHYHKFLPFPSLHSTLAGFIHFHFAQFLWISSVFVLFCLDSKWRIEKKVFDTFSWKTGTGWWGTATGHSEWCT